MPSMTIENITTEELPAIILGLVMKGLTFKCAPQPGYSSDVWRIQLLGGF